MPSRYLESTVLYFFEEKNTEVYYSICERGKEKIYKRHTFTFLKIREQMLVYVAKWARLGILVKVCDERKFNA